MARLATTRAGSPCMPTRDCKPATGTSPPANILNLNKLDKLAVARMTCAGHLTTSDDDGAAPDCQGLSEARRRSPRPRWLPGGPCLRVVIRRAFSVPAAMHHHPNNRPDARMRARFRQFTFA